MCLSSSKPTTVKSYKAATPAASPPSPTESPSTVEPAESATKQKKSTAKGKLSLEAPMSTPSSTGLNIFK